MIRYIEIGGIMISSLLLYNDYFKIAIFIMSLLLLRYYILIGTMCEL